MQLTVMPGTWVEKDPDMVSMNKRWKDKTDEYEYREYNME